VQDRSYPFDEVLFMRALMSVAVLRVLIHAAHRFAVFRTKRCAIISAAAPRRRWRKA